MKTSRKDDLEPYWQDEKDYIYTVEFLANDDPEARMFASDIMGHLFGYAHLTNTRSLALVGNPEANAYELLFSFSSSEEKGQFLELILCLAQMSSLGFNLQKERCGGRVPQISVKPSALEGGSRPPIVAA